MNFCSWHSFEERRIRPNPRNEKPMMATYGKVLLLMVRYTYFAVVNGNFTMHTPLNGSEILCLEDCDFLADNQTILTINSTNRRTSVTGIAYYSTLIRMKDSTTKRAASFNASFTFREEPQIYNASAQEEHVGLDVRSPISVPSCFAYVHDTLGVSLWKRSVLYSWIEYDGYTAFSSGILVALTAIGVYVYRRRKRRAQNDTRDNEGMVEMAGMPGFISYKHLSAATKQFSDQSKLGGGGFGSVYRGVLPKTGAQVSVKKVSTSSRQGEREFLAEVQIISHLRYRNLVELIGFCRDRGKFLLVYELLPRGSLDQALFKPKTPEDVLSWSTRWKIVCGTAAALPYLYEGWRQQVIPP